MIIETPIKKHKVELRDWITGREKEEIDKPMTSIKVSVGGEQRVSSSKEVDIGEITRQVKETSIRTVVVSIDGEKDDLVNKVYDMPVADFNFVVDKVEAIVQGRDFTKPE